MLVAEFPLCGFDSPDQWSLPQWKSACCWGRAVEVLLVLLNLCRSPDPWWEKCLVRRSFCLAHLRGGKLWVFSGDFRWVHKHREWDCDHQFIESRAQNSPQFELRLPCWYNALNHIIGCPWAISFLKPVVKRFQTFPFPYTVRFLFFHFGKMPFLSVIWGWTVLQVNNVIHQWLQYVSCATHSSGWKCTSHARLSHWDLWKMSNPLCGSNVKSRDFQQTCFGCWE